METTGGRTKTWKKSSASRNNNSGPRKPNARSRSANVAVLVERRAGRWKNKEINDNSRAIIPQLCARLRQDKCGGPFALEPDTKNRLAIIMLIIIINCWCYSVVGSLLFQRWAELVECAAVWSVCASCNRTVQPCETSHCTETISIRSADVLFSTPKACSHATLVAGRRDKAFRTSYRRHRGRRPPITRPRHSVRSTSSPRRRVCVCVCAFESFATLAKRV